MTTAASDLRYMTQALKLARRGLYTTHPNPRVGCVIVKNHDVIGSGWHRCTGEPHAEVLALDEAGAAARGATVYVNLEPCCHQGRTPPCSDSLIDAGIIRLVTAMQDPNPQVAGGGIQSLRGAGIEVEVGVLRAAAEELNRGFIRRHQQARPWVTMKIAIGLDGRTAMASGESRWITNEFARMDVHKLRARSSAILTGSGTVAVDDPQLTARIDGVKRQPLRVVVDSGLNTPGTAKVISGVGDCLIATARENVDPGRGIDSGDVEVVAFPGENGLVDLNHLMHHLSQREVNEVLVEAGATLNGALLRAGLVDELIVYMSPRIMGDAARGMFHLELERLADGYEFEIRDVRQLGNNIRFSLTPNMV